MGWTLTVTDLNDYVRRSLAGDPILQDISLRGEISNFKRHVSGHLYFSLKDDQSRIQCVMFRQNALTLAFDPADGMRVVLKGAVSLYVQAGSYQFYASHMTREGLGDLYLRFEELKKRLMAEGLFDVGKKRPLPLLPRLIGVVTAKGGAVVHDIARIAFRRNPGVQLILCPAKVQGEGAAEEIAASLDTLSRIPSMDVIIVGRGGGSIEDLWAFNEETVVRAIARCPVPVVSAVGHETDFTLADFAADVRAATPSAAAELTVQEKSVLTAMLGDLDARLFKATYDAVQKRRYTLSALEKRLALCHPLARINQAQTRLSLLKTRLNQSQAKNMTALKTRIQSLSDALKALGPAGVMERGYLVALAKGKPVTHVAQVRDEMTLLLSDGRAYVKTISVERGDPFGSESEDV